MQLLSGFISALGLATVAVAFVALNAASLGLTGLFVAAIGSTAMLIGGLGLFKHSANVAQKSQNLLSPTV